MLKKVALTLGVGIVGLMASLWVMWNYNFQVGLGYTVMTGVVLAITLVLLKRVD